MHVNPGLSGKQCFLQEVSMAAVTSRRVLLGALAGGGLWNVWSICVRLFVLAKPYTEG
jgi:hypothetical protein